MIIPRLYDTLNVNIKNGHYVLSTIRKTPVTNITFSSMIHVPIDISVITNNQEMMLNLLF